ncbi:MAG: FapA family protein [bacterium]
MNTKSTPRAVASASPSAATVRLKEGSDFDTLLSLNAAEMACGLTIRPKSKNISCSPADLMTRLRDLGIVEGVRENLLLDCCQKLAQGQPVQNVLVAEGSLPEPGTDASLEFLLPISAAAPHFAEDKTGHVDFHETHPIDNVQVGYELAVLHPAMPGKDGYTVTGRKMPAPPPRECPVQAGKGVGFQKQGNVFVATQDGYVIFKNNLLQVSEEYEVEGDLDLHTGNLRFIGNIHVHGDVLDGFHIQATKGLRIDKNAGQCRLECGGDLEIGGMNGLGVEADGSAKHVEMPHPSRTGTILCKGNLTARYLHHVYVECEGNVHVLREVMHSVIRCAGTVKVDGRILGGTCTALAGIEVAQAGTEAGARTELIAGEDYRLEQQEPEVAKTLDLLHHKRQALLIEVGAGDNSPQHQAKLSHEAQLRTDECFAQIAQLDEQVAELRRHLATPNRDPLRNPKINVLRNLCTGTVLQADGVEQKIFDTRTGPISAMAYQGEVRFLKMTPLSVSTVAMEQELQQQEQQAVLDKAVHLGIPHPEDMSPEERLRAIQSCEKANTEKAGV